MLARDNIPLNPPYQGGLCSPLIKGDFAPPLSRGTLLPPYQGGLGGIERLGTNNMIFLPAISVAFFFRFDITKPFGYAVPEGRRRAGQRPTSHKIGVGFRYRSTQPTITYAKFSCKYYR